MVHLVNIYLPHAIGRAYEFLFHVPRQVAAVEKPERPKVENQSDAVGVVGYVGRLRYSGIAKRIRFCLGRR